MYNIYNVDPTRTAHDALALAVSDLNAARDLGDLKGEGAAAAAVLIRAEPFRGHDGGRLARAAREDAAALHEQIRGRVLVARFAVATAELSGPAARAASGGHESEEGQKARHEARHPRVVRAPQVGLFATGWFPSYLYSDA